MKYHSKYTSTPFSLLSERNLNPEIQRSQKVPPTFTDHGQTERKRLPPHGKNTATWAMVGNSQNTEKLGPDYEVPFLLKSLSNLKTLVLGLLPVLKFKQGTNTFTFESSVFEYFCKLSLHDETNLISWISVSSK